MTNLPPNGLVVLRERRAAEVEIADIDEAQRKALVAYVPHWRQNHDPVMNLTPDSCRWPFGEPRTDGFRYCSEPVEAKSFCRAHYARAYRKATP